MTDDQWRPIPGWEGVYEITATGSIRSLPRVVPGGFTGSRRLPGRVLHPVKDPSGHLGVTLSAGAKRERASVHRLVARTFIGPCPEGEEVCHNNGDPADNRVENLRYDTRTANLLDAVKHGTHWQTKKTTCPRGHRLSGDNLPRKARRGRECKACHRAIDYVRYHPDRRADLQEISDTYYRKIMQGAPHE